MCSCDDPALRGACFYTERAWICWRRRFSSSPQPCILLRRCTAGVVHVIDGDGLIVIAGAKHIQVRLAGIDAPELRQPSGQPSRQSLLSLCGCKPADVVVTGKDRRPHHRKRTVRRQACQCEAGEARHGVGVRPLRGAVFRTLWVCRKKRVRQRAGCGQNRSPCRHGNGGNGLPPSISATL